MFSEALNTNYKSQNNPPTELASVCTPHGQSDLVSMETVIAHAIS